jgi:uncharacterized protein YdhG (YjbR/CyaY superfamily)
LAERNLHKGYAEVGQEHHRDRQDARGVHRRGTSRDEGARELKGKADGDSAVRASIGAMSPQDRAIPERIHELIKATAPDLSPKTWYGMPADAMGGKVVCSCRDAEKFKERYATFGFNDIAKLDDGSMWPVAYALTKLTKLPRHRPRRRHHPGAGQEQ